MILTSRMTTEQTVGSHGASIDRIMNVIWERSFPMEFSGEDRRKRGQE
jgi:hypothetical protein